MKDYTIVKHYLTKNKCYKAGRKRSTTLGIVKHSTGANNPNLCRYIDDPANLGENRGNNHWNMGNISKCVHFIIGKDKKGNIAIYQTLPLDYRCWGCGSGPRGSFNATHVQYEICEDGLKDEKYFKEAFEAAAWLDAYICKKYGLKPSSIVSHKEAHDRGYASNHGDCDHWLKKQGKTMSWARSIVPTDAPTKAPAKKPAKTPSTSSAFKPYAVKVGITDLNIRRTPEAKNDSNLTGSVTGKGTFTIVDEKNGWGLLKSYEKNRNGWIKLSLTSRA